MRDAAAVIPDERGAGLGEIVRLGRRRRRRTAAVNLAAVLLVVAAAGGGAVVLTRPDGAPVAQQRSVATERFLLSGSFTPLFRDDQRLMDAIPELDPNDRVRLIPMPAGSTPPISGISVPDGRVAVRLSGRLVMLAPDGRELLSRDLPVGSIVTATNRKLILAVNNSRTMISHDIGTGAEVTFDRGEALGWGANADQLIEYGGDETPCAVRFLDPATGKQLRAVSLPTDACDPANVRISPDGRLLAVQSLPFGDDLKARVVILDAATGAVRKEFPPEGVRFPSGTERKWVFAAFRRTDSETVKWAYSVIPRGQKDRLQQELQVSVYRL